MILAGAADAIQDCVPNKHLRGFDGIAATPSRISTQNYPIEPLGAGQDRSEVAVAEQGAVDSGAGCMRVSLSAIGHNARQTERTEASST